MIWLWITLGGFLALVLLPVGVGVCSSPQHKVARSWQCRHSASALWSIITDFPAVPSWYSHVRKVERLPDQAGQEVWRETFKGDLPMQLTTTRFEPPYRLTRQILDEKKVFFGRWEFELVPTDRGTELTITEYGEIPNLFIRGIARLAMNPALYIKQYLTALAARMGEPASFRDPLATPPLASSDTRG